MQRLEGFHNEKGKVHYLLQSAFPSHVKSSTDICEAQYFHSSLSTMTGQNLPACFFFFFCKPLNFLQTLASVMCAVSCFCSQSGKFLMKRHCSLQAIGTYSILLILYFSIVEISFFVFLFFLVNSVIKTAYLRPGAKSFFWQQWRNVKASHGTTLPVK